ncbi:unnamed protein product, partial [Adineta steineri]
MIIICIFKHIVLFLIIGVSYNLPTFSPCALWDTTGTVFADQNTIGYNFVGIFVDINNIVYFADASNNRVLVWSGSNGTLLRTITGSLKKPMSLFATMNGDIYVDNGKAYNEIDKWSWNTVNESIAMSVLDVCFGIFVDLNNTIYCSVQYDDVVIKQSLNDSGNSYSIAAGNEISGNGPDQLDEPQGIFVDVNFNLYVADLNNDRIQKFEPGSTSGTTVSTGSIILNVPTDVVLDANGYLFIVDSKGNRIIGSGPDGYRCILGCPNSNGTILYQFNKPQSLSFDSYGNIYVTDRDNYRIQKFQLASNYCDSTSTESITTTAITTTLNIEETTSIELTLSSTIITSDATSTDSTEFILNDDTTSTTTTTPTTTTISTTPTTIPTTPTTTPPTTTAIPTIPTTTTTIPTINDETPTQMIINPILSTIATITTDELDLVPIETTETDDTTISEIRSTLKITTGDNSILTSVTEIDIGTVSTSTTNNEHTTIIETTSNSEIITSTEPILSTMIDVQTNA